MSSPDFNKVKLVTRHSGKVTIKELQNNEIDGESLIAYEFIRKLFAEFARSTISGCFLITLEKDRSAVSLHRSSIRCVTA